MEKRMSFVNINYNKNNKPFFKSDVLSKAIDDSFMEILVTPYHYNNYRYLERVYLYSLEFRMVLWIIIYT